MGMIVDAHNELMDEELSSGGLHESTSGLSGCLHAAQDKGKYYALYLARDRGSSCALYMAWKKVISCVLYIALVLVFSVSLLSIKAQAASTKAFVIKVNDGYCKQNAVIMEKDGEWRVESAVWVSAYAEEVTLSLGKTYALYDEEIKNVAFAEKITLKKGRQTAKIRITLKNGKKKTIELTIKCPIAPTITSAYTTKQEVTVGDVLRIRMNVNGSVSGKAIVRIVSEDEETVYKKVFGKEKKAAYRAKWDMRDEDGDLISPGTYEVRFYLSYTYAGKTTYTIERQKLVVNAAEDAAPEGVLGSGLEVLSVGDIVSLELKTKKTVKWKSTDKSVAAVNKKGVVTAKGEGTCKIIATVKGVRYTCRVRVKTKSWNSVDEINHNLIWFGDSRSMLLGEYLYRYQRDREGVVDAQHVVAKNGGYYQWAASSGYSLLSKYLKANPNAVVVFNFGVNDVLNHYKHETAYIEFLQKIQDNYPDAKLVIMSINPVQLNKDRSGVDTQERADAINAEIDRYNAYFKENRPAGTFYVDTNSALEFVTADGIHYTAATYSRILDYMVNTLYQQQAALKK